MRRFEVPAGADPKLLRLLLDLDGLEDRYRSWLGRNKDKSASTLQKQTDREIESITRNANDEIARLERKIADVVNDATRRINDRKRFMTKRAAITNDADRAEQRIEEADRKVRTKKARQSAPVVLVLLDSLVQGGIMDHETRNRIVGEGWTLEQVNAWIAGDR